MYAEFDTDAEIPTLMRANEAQFYGPEGPMLRLRLEHVHVAASRTGADEKATPKRRYRR